MSPTPATTARLASRVILIDERDRVLFFLGTESLTRKSFWLMPGGGLDAGETFEDAARREAFEETGLSVDIGPCVWFRHHQYQWNGKPVDQFEKFFVARVTNPPEIAGAAVDSYLSEARWWSLEEILCSPEAFMPREVAKLLPPILRDQFPEEPIDCGI